MKRNIRLERTYPHPPELVWQALTQPELIERWMEMENDFQPIAGHEFTLRDVSGNWDGILHCRVVRAEPPSHLSYTFIGGFMKNETLVTLRLQPTSSGTRLILEHTGFTGIPDLVVSAIIGMGWRRMLKIMIDVLNSQTIPQPIKEI